MWLLVEQGKKNQAQDFFHTLLAFTLKLTGKAEQPGCAGQIGNCPPRLKEHLPSDTAAQDSSKCGIHTVLH